MSLPGWLTWLVTTDLVLLSRVAYRGQEVTSPRLRGLLALLAADLRAGASTARLVDGLWPDEQPENPTKALQVLVSRARAQLGPDRHRQHADRLPARPRRGPGGQLRGSASTRPPALRQARAGDHAGALAARRGGAGAVGRGPRWPTRRATTRSRRCARTARRRTGRCARSRALALSRLGRRAEAVEPLAELVEQQPRDEEVLLELLRCEAATLGPAAALARYEAYRRRAARRARRRSRRRAAGSAPGAAAGRGAGGAARRAVTSRTRCSAAPRTSPR